MVNRRDFLKTSMGLVVAGAALIVAPKAIPPPVTSSVANYKAEIQALQERAVKHDAMWDGMVKKLMGPETDASFETNGFEALKDPEDAYLPVYSKKVDDEPASVTYRGHHWAIESDGKSIGSKIYVDGEDMTKLLYITGLSIHFSPGKPVTVEMTVVDIPGRG
jgi:hypothetical protein